MSETEVRATDAPGRDQEPPLTGGQSLVRQLQVEGVDVIFGLPGDQLMVALDALVDAPDLRYIVTRHEQATTYMADGYARAAGRPGVAMVVPGVGVYNAASGLATAHASSAPVLQIAGQVNRDGIGVGRGLLHEIHDQLDVVRPITKWCARAMRADDIAPAVRTAFAQMATGRPRPTHVEIPPEAFGETCDGPALPPTPPAAVAADETDVERAAALLAKAESPLIVAGGGVVLGDASADLVAVAELLQAPVVTSREGKGSIDDRHPLSVGTMWVNRRLRPVLDGADVVLAVGTRLLGFGFGEHQQIVHLDIDEAEVGRNHPPAVGLVGHAAPSLDALAEALRPKVGRRRSRADEVRSRRASVDAELAAIGPQGAMVDALRAGVPDDGILVCDTTTVAYMCHMKYPVYEPRTYLTTSYMGTLGFAYPAALGAKVARPDRPVVAVVGDGGFLYASNELATAVQHDIPTVTVVFDDGAYGNSNRDQRERFGGRELGTVLQNPDWVALARAFGADAVKVERIDQLAGAVREACGHSRSTVVAVPMDRLPSPF